MVGLLVLDFSNGARERAELRAIEESYEETTETTAETTVETTTTEPTTEPTTEETTTVYIPSVEELAEEVIDKGITGDDRKAYLGDRYDEVQKWIDENFVPPVVQQDVNYVSTDVNYVSTSGDGGGVLTPSAGVNYYNGRMETYYNLPMGGVLDIMYSLGYSGEYWVRGDGVKMFGNYVMVACDFGEYPRGSIIETSLGTAIVCDTGSGGWGWTDIAVTW